jgi:hypothetical protein
MGGLHDDRLLTGGGQPVVRYVAIIVVAAALAGGCGGGSKPASSPAGGAAGSTPSAAPRTVVFFQRQGAAGATLDTITVRSDGTATHDMRYGGAGGRFRDYILRRGVLARIRRALHGLPARSSLGMGPVGNAQYLLRFDGRTMTGRLGGISRRARPAVKVLDGLLDGIGVAETTRQNQTHSR